MKTTYKAQGTIIGYLWDGSLGYYGSKTFHADSLSDLNLQIEDALEKNQATGTGDFQSQIGAAMSIDTISDIEIDGKVYSNVTTNPATFGQLTEDQAVGVWDAHYYNA